MREMMMIMSIMQVLHHHQFHFFKRIPTFLSSWMTPKRVTPEFRLFLSSLTSSSYSSCQLLFLQKKERIREKDQSDESLAVSSSLCLLFYFIPLWRRMIKKPESFERRGRRRWSTREEIQILHETKIKLQVCSSVHSASISGLSLVTASYCFKFLWKESDGKYLEEEEEETGHERTKDGELS